MNTYPNGISFGEIFQTLLRDPIPIAFTARAQVMVTLLRTGHDQEGWLRENCAGRYSGSIHLMSTGKLALDVGFEDTNDALLFKLAWGGEV